MTNNLYIKTQSKNIHLNMNSCGAKVSDINKIIEEMNSAIAFGKNCLFPAYQEIQYIVMHTDILFEDIDENLRILNKVVRKSEKKRSVVSRNTIRSSCSCIDGFSYILKDALKLTLNKPNQELFSKKQLNYISNDFTNGSGADNLKESLKCFAKKYGVDVSDIFGGEGFNKLKKLFEIRNRLMHPKNKNDFHISKDETILLTEAIIWFVSTQKWIFEMIFEKITTQANDIFLLPMK